MTDVPSKRRRLGEVKVLLVPTHLFGILILTVAYFTSPSFVVNFDVAARRTKSAVQHCVRFNAPFLNLGNSFSATSHKVPVVRTYLW